MLQKAHINVSYETEVTRFYSFIIEGLRSKRAIKRNFGENEFSVRSGTLMLAANTG